MHVMQKHQPTVLLPTDEPDVWVYIVDVMVVATDVGEVQFVKVSSMYIYYARLETIKRLNMTEMSCHLKQMRLCLFFE